MAAIELRALAHSYLPAPRAEIDSDWALKSFTHRWEDGGAYALLGPSGCGKTTLLNIISGLVAPSRGRVLFDGRDVAGLPPEKRNVAQVFQFPVVYDTMTARENLAFPLKNRGVAPAEIKARVDEVARLLEIDDMLDRRAANLSPDAKQKISLGRGIARADAAAILFDEPLTVIDPRLKWRLRGSLKRLHRRVDFTMIYVTHDQTEALTFADRVIVMRDGRMAQSGAPSELFDRPRHTFVGHFIGSPGMNILPAAIDGGAVFAGGRKIETAPFPAAAVAAGAIEIGVRPEFVRFAADGLPARVRAVQDLGRRRVIEVEAAGARIKMVDTEGGAPPESPRIAFVPERTFVYVDGWLAGEKAS